MKNDLWLYLGDYLPFALLCGSIVAAGTYVLFTFVSLLCSRNWDREFIKKLPVLFSFYSYIFLVAGITFLSREAGSRGEVNLKLFGTITGTAYGNRYVVENVLLFIPFGIMFPLLIGKLHKIQSSMATGFILSLIIEISQYISKRGYFQVDDILFNSLGTLIGYGIFFGAGLLYRSLAGWFLEKKAEI